MIWKARWLGLALGALALGACKMSSVTLGSDTGGAGGSGAAGGSGTAPTYRIGTAAECPADLSHAEGTSCGLPSDVVCTTQLSQGGWTACTCGCEHAGQWECMTASGPGPACPLDQPAHHGACSGYEGAACMFFPSTVCTCSTTTHAWSCAADPDETGGQWKCLSPPSPGGDPPGIDPGKVIADLTDAEAQAWCEWFVTSVHTEGGAAPPPDRMVSPDGTVSGYAALMCGQSPSLCVERLSIDHCVANLKLDGCSATVRQLDDCAHTMANACQVVGQGCDPFVAQPSCSRTIVTTVDEPSGNCKLPVQ